MLPEEKPPHKLTDEQLIKQINAAFVNSHSSHSLDATAQDLQRILTSPTIGAVIRSIRVLASEQGISEASAAADIVEAMQKLDRIWNRYLIQEGLARIQGSSS